MSSETVTDGAPAMPRFPAEPAHSRLDDAIGVLTGTFLASFGLFLLKSAGAMTGGTAGLSLLLGRALPLPFAAIFIAVNVPFVMLAATRKGWNFTLRSVAAVALVSGLSLLHPHTVTIGQLAPAYGALVGNLLAGIGILVLFRHHASIGGFSIIGLLSQERIGWRAGYVQFVLDALVIAGSALIAPATTVLYSAAGAMILNLVLAMNHRPGRYLGQ